MARINIEDSLFKDCRFMELLIKVGDQDKALGILTRAWMIAQKWWLTPGKTIPLSEWKNQKLSDALIEVGLAELVDGKIRMAGAEEQFSWLEQRVKAGRKGGLSRGPRNDSTISQAVASGRLANAKPLSLSLSLSPALSLAQSLSQEETTNTKYLPGGFSKNAETSARSADASGTVAEDLNLGLETEQKPKTASRKEPISRETWEAYSKAYWVRYEVEPVRNVTVNARLAQFVKRLGKEEAPLVAKFYLTHNGFAYVNSGHAVGMLLRDAEKLRTEWATGRRMTTSEARQTDRKQNIYNVFSPFIAEAEERERLEREKGNDHG